MISVEQSIKKLEKQGLLKTELQLGIVSSVSAHTLRVNLGYAGNPSAAYFSGGRYGKGEVGEFVLIESQQGLLFGRVVEVRLPESERREVSQDYSGANHLDAIAMVQLLGSVPMDDIAITVGIDNYPRLGDRVYAAPHQFIALIPALMDLKKSEKQKVVRLRLGTIAGANDSNVLVTPETLFGRHCGILGATGGGKSWTTARIIEECMKHQSKIILLDATGEYRDFSGEHVMHCHLGDPVKLATGSISCSLPPTSFQESDFIALFDPAGKVQGPKLKAAIQSLRVATLNPDIASGGIIKKIGQAKSNYITAIENDLIASQIDNPRQPFNVKKLVKQIEQECVYPDGFTSGTKDILKWGSESGEYSYCLSLVSRINGVLSSNAFKCVFQDSSSPITPITEKINEFLLDNSNQRLLRICLSGIQYEFKAREIISNVLGRYLLSEARTGKFKENPLIVIVDEAHNFLGKHIGSEDSQARLDAFELIAKEGRKYELNICLATQRPRDITEGVLSQMGTLIVHRLTNDRDREVVERACGEIDRSASAFLPNLKPGEAALIGVDFPIPLTVQISEPNTRPHSNGADFQKSWTASGDSELN